MPTICRMKIEVQNFINNNIFIEFFFFFLIDSRFSLWIHRNSYVTFFCKNVTKDTFFFFRSYSFVFHFWTIAYHNYFWSIHSILAFHLIKIFAWTVIHRKNRELLSSCNFLPKKNISSHIYIYIYIYTHTLYPHIKYKVGL